MLNVCPIILIQQDRAIPARYMPVNRKASRYGAGHLEQVETLGEVLDRLGCVRDRYTLDRDALVVWCNPATNFWCGGEVKWDIGIAKRSIGRWEQFQCERVCVSLQPDGSLETAIPC